MPHYGQILPLAARRGSAALIGALIAAACVRSGDVVVMIDSTMWEEFVEVVALPVDPFQVAPGGTRPTLDATDGFSRLRTLDDSVAALETRFRVLRDELRSEVYALDAVDRRTRAYAVRYAEIRRRTLAAEALRSERDLTRARADTLRTTLGASAGAAAARKFGSGDPAATNPDGRRAERRPIRQGALALSLAPGRWWIGVAVSGAQPARYDSLTVRRGVTDTVRFRAGAMR